MAGKSGKAVRAKFWVAEVRAIAQNGSGLVAEEVKMRPVYSSDPHSENRSFAQATPDGEFRLVINNPQLFSYFTPGDEFYIDLTRIEKEA